jgi:hypothetical protein
MRVQQLSIFLENKSGRMAEISNILGQACVNIRALSLADTTDFGIVRLIVDDEDKAVNVLKENGITVVKTDVTAVELPDKPGGLAKALNVLQQKNIGIEYLYSAATRKDKAYIIFRFDNAEKAIEALQSADIRVLTREDLLEIEK